MFFFSFSFLQLNNNNDRKYYNNFFNIKIPVSLLFNIILILVFVFILLLHFFNSLLLLLLCYFFYHQLSQSPRTTNTLNTVQLNRKDRKIQHHNLFRVSSIDDYDIIGKEKWERKGHTFFVATVVGKLKDWLVLSTISYCIPIFLTTEN